MIMVQLVNNYLDSPRTVIMVTLDIFHRSSWLIPEHANVHAYEHYSGPNGNQCLLSLSHAIARLTPQRSSSIMMEERCASVARTLVANWLYIHMMDKTILALALKIGN